MPTYQNASVSPPVRASAVCHSAVFGHANVSLVLASTGLPDGAVGASYSQSLLAVGGTTPYAYSIVSGALPAGLSLDSSSGIISGIPTAAAAAAFTIRVTDASGSIADQAFSISVGTGSGSSGGGISGWIG